MKFFAYNDKINDLNEFGSFTVVARKLNEQFNILNVLGDINDPECFVIYPEVFETQKVFNKQIPYLACEYSLAPQIVIDRLNSYNPFALAISKFAKNNIINSGYENIDYVHLGTDENFWKKTEDEKFPVFTYLTVNSSNDRSGFESLIPAFLKFSENKNVNLIIKDGKNEDFKNYIHSINNGKIIYIDEMMDEVSLRKLYNQSHLFIYANNTTSFGMNPMDSVMCETPAITTLGSALKEFIPEWTQPYKIRTTVKKISAESIREWDSIGLRSFPEYFLNLFNGEIFGEKVIEEDVFNVLNFSIENYDLYLKIAQKHKEFIIKNYTWRKCAETIIEKVKNYDQFRSR
jgi:glycosyltransferase involved in cell wall biosynthesis